MTTPAVRAFIQPGNPRQRYEAVDCDPDIPVGPGQCRARVIAKVTGVDLSKHVAFWLLDDRWWRAEDRWLLEDLALLFPDGFDHSDFTVRCAELEQWLHEVLAAAIGLHAPRRIQVCAIDWGRARYTSVALVHTPAREESLVSGLCPTHATSACLRDYTPEGTR